MKIILNILWGTLCEKNHFIYSINDDVDVDLIDKMIKVKGKELVKCVNYL